MSATSAIWGTFCHHRFLLSAPRDAERWSAARADIEILSLDEGFAIAQSLAGVCLRCEVRPESSA